jgi:hypothetical protein
MAEPDFQLIGDRLTRALIHGDFAQYSQVMGLPLRITPREGQAYVLADLPALREDFDLYHAVIRQHGVTDIFRQALSQDALGPGRCRVHCLTHIMARAHRLVDPFPTRFLLAEGPEGWRIVEIESSEGHITWTLGRTELLPEGHFGTEGRQGDAED